jgi:hypothetical protein
MLRGTASRKDPVAARCAQTNKFESKASIRTGDKDSVHGHGSSGNVLFIAQVRLYFDDYKTAIAFFPLFYLFGWSPSKACFVDMVR